MWRDYRPGFAQFLALTFFLLSATVLTLVATGIARDHTDPTRRVNISDTLAQYHFDSTAEDWRTFDLGEVAFFNWDEERGKLVGAVQPERGHLTTTNRTEHRNVVIDAHFDLEQLPANAAASMGIQCRASTQGDGYYFLVATTGRASIQKGLPTQPELEILVPWEKVRGLQPDTTAFDLTAICAADYLALYVNGVFAIEAFDSDLSAGLVGAVLAGAVQNNNPESPNARVWVSFDDIIVREAARVSR